MDYLCNFQIDRGSFYVISMLVESILGLATPKTYKVVVVVCTLGIQHLRNNAATGWPVSV